MTPHPVIRTLVVLWIGACQPAGSPDAAAPPPDTGAHAAAGTPAAPRDRIAECENPAWGYRLAYPAGWRTNTGEVVPRCSLFDPDPVEVRPATELPLDIAITVQRESAPMGRVTGEQIGRRVLSRERTTVAGRDAVRMEAESTGEALYPAGMRSYRYVVDLHDHRLILSTHDLGGLDYQHKRQVLDEVAATLRFTGR